MKMKRILIFSLLATLLVACGNNSVTTPTTVTSSTTSVDVQPSKLDPVVTKQTKALNKDSLLRVDDGPLPYRLHVPSDYDGDTYHYPVFIFLHGAGERGNDNTAQLKNAVQYLFDDLESPLYQSIAFFPQCPSQSASSTGLSQWVDTPWANGNYSIDNVPESDDLKAVLEILETLKEQYSINDRRVYVMGLSMGGFGTWDLIMRHPEMFAGAVPVCGGGDTSQASKLVNIPIYTFHGTSDTTVPYTGTRDMALAIKNAGGTMINYDELKGYGHNVWDYAAKKERLMSWLFSHSK